MFGDLLHIKPMIWICELPIHLLHILVMVFVMAVIMAVHVILIYYYC